MFNRSPRKLWRYDSIYKKTLPPRLNKPQYKWTSASFLHEGAALAPWTEQKLPVHWLLVQPLTCD